MVDSLLSLLDPLTLPKHRRTRPEQTHLTVLYLGARSGYELPDVIESARAACAGVAPFSLRPVALTALPERGRKRTVVVECDRPAGLRELHDRFVRRFARDENPRRRERFLPHLTIARFPGSGAECTLRAPLSLGAFPVDAIRLLSSELKPAGAVHSEIERIDLDAN